MVGQQQLVSLQLTAKPAARALSFSLVLFSELAALERRSCQRFTYQHDVIRLVVEVLGELLCRKESMGEKRPASNLDTKNALS